MEERRSKSFSSCIRRACTSPSPSVARRDSDARADPVASESREMDMEESLEGSTCCDTWSRSCSATVSSASIALGDSDALFDASSSACTRDSRTVLSSTLAAPAVLVLGPEGPLGLVACSSLRSAWSSWRSAVWRREPPAGERREESSEAGCGAPLRMERLRVMERGGRDRNRCDAREREGMSGSACR